MLKKKKPRLLQELRSGSRWPILCWSMSEADKKVKHPEIEWNAHTPRNGFAFGSFAHPTIQPNWTPNAS